MAQGFGGVRGGAKNEVGGYREVDATLGSGFFPLRFSPFFQ